MCQRLCRKLPRRSGLEWAEKGSNQQRPSTSGDNSQIPFGLRKLRRQIKERLQFWPEGKKPERPQTSISSPCCKLILRFVKQAECCFHLGKDGNLKFLAYVFVRACVRACVRVCVRVCVCVTVCVCACVCCLLYTSPSPRDFG